MGGTNVTDFASIWEWEDNREWNELLPAIGLDLLACFCSLQVFFGRSMEQTEWAKWFALIWARHMFAPRYHNYCFDITAFYHNNRSDCLHIQSLNDFPRICICRCINLSCIALHERREAKTHRPASPKAAREPGYDRLYPKLLGPPGNRSRPG